MFKMDFKLSICWDSNQSEQYRKCSVLDEKLCESLWNRVHRNQFMDFCKQANFVHKNGRRAIRAARSPLCPDMWWTVLAWFWHFFCATAFLLQRNSWGLLLNFSSSRNLLAATPFLMNGVVSSDASGHVAPRGRLVLDRCVAADAKPRCSFVVSVLKERRKMCFAVFDTNLWTRRFIISRKKTALECECSGMFSSPTNIVSYFLCLAMNKGWFTHSYV